MRTTIGFILTFLILAVGFSVIYFRDEINTDIGLDPNEVGDFLAGLFAPIALTWLIIAYYQQSHELRQNNIAMREQVKESNERNKSLERQIEALRHQMIIMEKNSFIDSYQIRYNELVFRCASMMRGIGDTAQWSRNLDWFSSGYFDAFPNWLKNYVRESGKEDFIFRLEKIFSDCDAQFYFYCERFEAFVVDADKADSSRELRRVIEMSGLGAAYVTLCIISGRTPNLIFRKLEPQEKLGLENGFPTNDDKES